MGRWMADDQVFDDSLDAWRLTPPAYDLRDVNGDVKLVIIYSSEETGSCRGIPIQQSSCFILPTPLKLLRMVSMPLMQERLIRIDSGHQLPSEGRSDEVNFDGIGYGNVVHNHSY